MPSKPRHKMRPPEGPEGEGGANDATQEEREVFDPAMEQAAAPVHEPAEDAGVAEAAATDDAPPADEVPAWRERAAFHVSFDYTGATLDEAQWRTQIYHEESDTHEQWEGIEGPRLLDWMRAHGELPTLAYEAPLLQAHGEQYEEEEAAEAPEEDYPTLAMGELWLAEVLIEEELGAARVPRIGPSYTKRVRSQVSFSLSNPAAIAATMRHSRYVVQVLSCDLATGQQLVLAEESQSLQPFVDEYHSVSEFSLPDVGRYRIMATVLLPDEGAAGLALGPVLTVVV